MELPSVTSSRTAEGRRIEAAEAAVAELDQRLTEWDDQRALVAAAELGDDPHAHVPATWPTVAEARASAAGRLAAPLSPAAVEAECSELRWAGLGKLIGAGISAAVLLSVPLTLVLHALVGS
ncbi:hypothetical protein [Dietzia kunjamensis]|uniref:hypothetical protein n=1 Tax=Dietzia kunjamensis TaxID=322509 RepID=UPI002097B395|nr:hypothetical protein [Dietzia kunjamensis]MEB8327275.1 hypothetical protein [Dietzia kunjamensis]USX45094.1 hypothetical protein NHB83_12700 [Dietzia kunjamensis]